MNRIACLLVSASLLSSGVVFAQGELDAYRYSQTELNGTARYLGMGGAFGALGGDISSMSSNPAGLGIYRSSEIVTTLSLSSIKAKSDWGGSKVDANKTKFNFDNIAYVGYFPTGNDEGLIGWNVGFSYNRVKISIVIIVCVALKITHWLIMQQLRRLMPERIGIAVNGLVFQKMKCLRSVWSTTNQIWYMIS